MMYIDFHNPDADIPDMGADPVGCLWKGICMALMVAAIMATFILLFEAIRCGVVQ
jgi:hypothetical protein